METPSDRGQALIELVIVMALLAFILFVSFDFEQKAVVRAEAFRFSPGRGRP